MDSSNIFWKFCSPNNAYAFNPYVPPCERDPYYDDPRDVKPGSEDNPIEMVQCRQCGTYFVPDASQLRSYVSDLCEKCRNEASQ